MNRLMESAAAVVAAAPWLVLAACALLIGLIAFAVVMKWRRGTETAEWAEQCRRLSEELRAKEQERKETADQLTGERQKSEKACEELEAARAEFDSRMQTGEAEHAERLAEKEAELERLRAQIDQWNMGRDAIISEARKQADQIIADADRSAMHTLDEAARRLAESEEEIRKNQLIAAGSLTDARKRISEMLLSAASELCKGIPTGSPIGFAPVYRLEETGEEKQEQPDEAVSTEK